MQRCINCGKAILWYGNNLCDLSLFTGICKQCHESSNAYELAKMVRHNRESKEAEEKQREYELERELHQDRQYYRELKASRKSQKENVEFDYDPVAIENEEKLQKENSDKLKEIEYIETMNVLNARASLIKKAEIAGLNNHAFDSKNICFFCKTHIDKLTSVECVTDNDELGENE